MSSSERGENRVENEHHIRQVKVIDSHKERETEGVEFKDIVEYKLTSQTIVEVTKFDKR